MYIGASGLFSDVWAAWTELVVNIGVTLCLAPFYGIVGILLGKITSVFFIAMFWKPFFLFRKGLQLPVSNYWRGMFPYYTIFAVFTIIVLVIRYSFMDSRLDSLVKLISYGPIVFIPIILSYFLTLLYITKGMKFFIARKPGVYRITQKYLGIK